MHKHSEAKIRSFISILFAAQCAMEKVACTMNALKTELQIQTLYITETSSKFDTGMGILDKQKQSTILLGTAEKAFNDGSQGNKLYIPLKPLQPILHFSSARFCAPR